MKIKIREAAQKFKGWSLYRLAKEMGAVEQTVYSWAQGKTQPNFQNMDRLCDAIGCTLDDLYEPELVGG